MNVEAKVWQSVWRSKPALTLVTCMLNFGLNVRRIIALVYKNQ